MNRENDLDVTSCEFWDECYNNNDTGWDLGEPTPIFINWCNHLKTSKKICIPGVGNGYDSLYFASKGHEVTAIDFAQKPIEHLKQKSKINNLNLILLQKDIFNLDKKLNNKFDFIIEYTCYCAIVPKMRNRYIDIMYELLKEGGQ